MEKILTIIGHTASGKTSLAVESAKLIKGEVISLDSRQIYEGMSIGTAQPTKNEMAGVPHHLFGFRDPSEPISAGEYVQLVRAKVKDVQANGKTPIICGGAGLYYRALSKGIFTESVSDLPTRDHLEQAYDDNSIALYEMLQAIDPDYADIVHINNKKRLVRALEMLTHFRLFRLHGLARTHTHEPRRSTHDARRVCVCVWKVEFSNVDGPDRREAAARNAAAGGEHRSARVGGHRRRHQVPQT